ncbi:PASTA domain-containing protein [Curtobacterium flaccumfaciens]|nr:PASTA domain-containing protein [Curtobacterium flaccumfaciens]
MPNVAGATYDSAASALEKRDLVPVKVEENSDDVDKGTVIRTEPGPEPTSGGARTSASWSRSGRNRWPSRTSRARRRTPPRRH